MKVFLITVMTADGLIGRDANHLSLKWTSREDKRRYVRLTKGAGAVVFGANTFNTFNKALPERRTIVYTRHPERIIAKDVETTDESPADLVARLEKEDTKSLAVCGGASIYDMFIQSGLVTDLYLTIEPILFGKGTTSFSKRLDVPLSLLEVERPNDNTLFLHYAVSQPK